MQFLSVNIVATKQRRVEASKKNNSFGDESKSKFKYKLQWLLCELCALLISGTITQHKLALSNYLTPL